MIQWLNKESYKLVSLKLHTIELQKCIGTFPYVSSSRVKIILLGIISIVCIARTSGKTDVRLETTMTSWSEASWAWRGPGVSLPGDCPWPLRNVPLLLSEEWEGGCAFRVASTTRFLFQTNKKKFFPAQLTQGRSALARDSIALFLKLSAWGLCEVILSSCIGSFHTVSLLILPITFGTIFYPQITSLYVDW